MPLRAATAWRGGIDTSRRARPNIDVDEVLHVTAARGARLHGSSNSPLSLQQVARHGFWVGRTQSHYFQGWAGIAVADECAAAATIHDGTSGCCRGGGSSGDSTTRGACAARTNPRRVCWSRRGRQQQWCGARITQLASSHPAHPLGELSQPRAYRRSCASVSLRRRVAVMQG